MSVGTKKKAWEEVERKVSVPYVRDVRWDMTIGHVTSSLKVSVPYVRDVRWDKYTPPLAGKKSVSVPYVRDVRWDI